MCDRDDEDDRTKREEHSARAGDAAEGKPPAADVDVDVARRRLLKAMVYAAPVVTSKVLIQTAHAQAASCGPASCRPRGGDCNPMACKPWDWGCPPSD